MLIMSEVGDKLNIVEMGVEIMHPSMLVDF